MYVQAFMLVCVGPLFHCCGGLRSLKSKTGSNGFAKTFFCCCFDEKRKLLFAMFAKENRMTLFCYFIDCNSRSVIGNPL
jgi:hypothetical protein